ncbi:unnamed protein product [marine sediment metagenome]|uniref:Uncharacterized protein n=1 Tax=marine sediment metagenome TaxID=412755 RepID=X1T123_9ZZZZ
MTNITLDPITKRFTQSIPEEKTCYICNGDNFVDDHHYDLQYGKISEETVPLCRRCHKTIHMYRGIHMFEDVYLDRAIEVWNRTQVLLNRPLMTKDKIERSKYWLKKHGIKGVKGIDEGEGSQTPAFPFHLPHGEPLCGWDWFNEHLYDLLDYVPRIEVVGPGIDLAVDISNKRELGKVSKALKGLKVNKGGNNKKVITLNSKTKRFKEVQNVV